MKVPCCQDDPALVKPPQWKGEPLDAVDLAILAATVPDVRQMTRRLSIAPDQGVPLFISRFYIVSPFWALAGPFIGAPYAVMLLETLLAWGIRRFIFFGWCGAVSPDIQAGDVILPTAGFSDEGTSRHYMGGLSEPPSPSARLINDLDQALDSAGLVVRKGPVCSTDAIFRETPRQIAGFRKMGALCVDMELSAVLAAGRALGAEVGAVLLVSDNVSGGQWLPGFSTERFKEARRVVYNTLINLCESLWIPTSEKEQKHSETP